MKRLIIILLSFFSLTVFAKGTDKTPFPAWFMQPAEHTYVGICEPNGDVQEAINAALLHYLICHDCSGTINRTNLVTTDSEEYTSIQQIMLRLDTTVQYSIEEIVSTSNGEYICRISDRPTLSRRILATYVATYNMKVIGGKETTNMDDAVQCYYSDETGKSCMMYMRELSKDETGYDGTSSSQYVHENGVTKEHTHNPKKPSYGEQLFWQYMSRLESGFIEKTGGSGNQDALSNAHHKPNPITEFIFDEGYINIAL